MLNCPQFIAISLILLTKTVKLIHIVTVYANSVADYSKFRKKIVIYHLMLVIFDDGSSSPTVKTKPSCQQFNFTTRTINNYRPTHTWKVKYKLIIWAVKLPHYSIVGADRLGQRVYIIRGGLGLLPKLPDKQLRVLLLPRFHQSIMYQ